jgi:hypothetical protein
MQIEQKIDLFNLRVADFELPEVPVGESFPQGRILISPLLLPISRYFWRD